MVNTTSRSSKHRTLPETMVRMYMRYAVWINLVIICTFVGVQVALSIRQSNIDAMEQGTHKPPQGTLTPRRRSGARFGRINDIPKGLPSAVKDEQALVAATLRSDPVVPSTPKSSKPLRVVFIGLSSFSLTLDGLDRSRYFKVIQTVEYDSLTREVAHHKVLHSSHPEDPLLFVVDWSQLSRDCHTLQKIWEDAKMPALYNDKSTILFVDWSASPKQVKCSETPFDQAHHARRGVVKNRVWNSTKGWVDEGQLVAAEQPDVIHSPYFLRENFVESLTDLVQKASHGAQTTLSEVVHQPRRVDIAHCWKKGDYLHYTMLRRAVSGEIVEFDKKSSHLRWVVRRFVGDDWQGGEIDATYLAELLSTKIIVISQHDEWEDHYRLMESLASGAMVMSDKMIAPPQGLVNGTNIVLYDDGASLQRLLAYYLGHRSKREDIAQRGLEYALGRHRSWHAMERVVFGKAISTIHKPFAAAPERQHKPKHAHELSPAMF